METTSAAAPFFLPFVLGIGIWVSWSDLARMKIPNAAVIALAVVFLVIGPFVLPFEEYLWRVGVGVIMFFVGWILTALRTMGAGDAKFIAAAAPYLPPTLVGLINFIFPLAVLLLLTFAVHRICRAIPAVRGLAPGWESWTSKKFPMGVPLALTLIYVMARATLRV